MTLNLVEAIWAAVNVTALVFTLQALRGAIEARNVVRRWNGEAREIDATAGVRRESLRVLIHALFVGVVIQPALTPGDVKLSPAIVLLMLAPVVLLLNTYLDHRATARILALTDARIEADRDLSLERLQQQGDAIEEAVAANTAVTEDTHARVVELVERDDLT